jgi:serine phosphatase RsbU (regulator of sigma subunit)
MASYSILVVEDEHTLLRLLEYRLSKQYDVRTAANGEEALVKIAERLPDLIISDIMMPKMDGFALQAALHERKETRAIPFIFLTAKADEQSRLKGMRTGVDDYITKPFDIEQLLTRVERLLERANLYQTQLDARIGEDFSKRLMPKSLPQAPGYRTFFHNHPREHGGGDLFDWTEAEPGVYFITIGDVMGKGLQAKFYAFSFLAYMRSILHAMLKTTHSPAELMTRVNQVLMEDPPMEETFASLLLMRWEPQENRITYTNAGHCRPLLVTREETKVVTYSDLVLGLNPHAQFKDTTLEMPPHSALVTYTDGLVEQQMRSGEMLGEPGLMKVLSEAFDKPKPVDWMLDEVLQNSIQPEFQDDILVFWLERLKKVDQRPSGPRWFSPFLDLTDIRQ